MTDKRIVTVDYLEEYAKGLNIPSVDQTYSPTSENAQSGKAVAQAVSSRVPKKVANPGAPFPSVIATSNGSYDESFIPTDDSYMCIDTVGAELGKDVNSNSAFIDSIPRRDSKGNLFTGTPVDDEDCVNKKYITDNYIPIKTSELQEYQVYAIPDVVGAKSVDYLTVENPMYFENGQSLGTIPSRQTNGNIMTNAPVKDLDCANKKYVDDKIAAIPSGGAVDDVQINGKSVVTDGAANIPIAANRKLGVIQVGAGLSINSSGKLFVSKAENGSIDGRNDTPSPIVPSNIDYAVKAAMCDGKGAEWTAEEQAAARSRMGIGDYELIEEFTLPEEIHQISRDHEPDGTPYNFKSMAILIYVPAHTNADAMFRFNGKHAALVTSTLWSNVIKTTNTYSSLVLKNIGTNLFELYKGSGNQLEYPDSTVALRRNEYSNLQGDEITSFTFGVSDSVNNLPVGTDIKIYGVR